MSGPGSGSWVERSLATAPRLETQVSAKRLPRALLDRWRTVLREWNAPEAVQRSLVRLDDPATQVVVAGQQPGIWGGPIYSVYKAATAVALARRLESRTGDPAVPVYWVQADDTDWGEVGWGAVPRRDLSIYRKRWKSGPAGSRHWVGGVRIDFPLEAGSVFEEWETDGPLLGTPREGESAELSRGFIDFLLAYFGAAGLLPLDSRWDEVRAGGRELWMTYFREREEIASAVASRGDAMQAEGKTAPLDGDTLHYGLFALDGEHRLPLDPDLWPTQVSKRLDRGEAFRLAPSVLLRAVLQDHLFGTAFHVVGETEGAYLEQLEPVYRRLSVTPPMRIPRFRGTVIPSGLLPAESIREGIRDPEAWIASRAGGNVDPQTLRALQVLREHVDAGMNAVAEALGEGQDVAQITESTRRKMQGQINRLEGTVDKRARQRLYQEQPALRNLPEFLRPRRGPQDRGLSGAALALILGERAPAMLLEACDEHLDRVQRGELHHFILEGPRG